METSGLLLANCHTVDSSESPGPFQHCRIWCW